MKIRKTIYRVLLLGGMLCLAAGLLAYLTDYIQMPGPLLIAGLVFLAFGFQGFEGLRSFSYTVAIFAAVTVSMFYPAHFISIGGFQLKLLIVPLLQIIMFGMGSQLSLNDFVNVIRMPRGVIIGIFCHYTIMPILGITIARSFGFPAEIAAGIVLVGTSPSGLASNVMNYIAKANVPLSVTITAVATLLSPLLTPALMKFLAGQFVPVNFWAMMLDITNLVILPIIAGLLFNAFGYGKKTRKELLIELTSFFILILLRNMIILLMGKGLLQIIHSLLIDVIWFMILPVIAGWVFRKFTGGKKELIDAGLSFISMAGIGIIITIITAVGRESLLQMGLLLLLACLIHNSCGYLFGYWFCRLIRMDERSCRTVALEVGMQNAGLASGIALQMGKVATVGLAPAVFGPLMNITGSSLASWWKGKPVKDDENKVNPNPETHEKN